MERYSKLAELGNKLRAKQQDDAARAALKVAESAPLEDFTPSNVLKVMAEQIEQGTVKVYDAAPGMRGKVDRPDARWVQIGSNWLKLVADTRPNHAYRLIRIDLYDTDRDRLVASFYRRTSKGGK